ncbi:MAG: MBL fold metallo-hydrolase [Cephaloticoccus sp.]|nr:MBL fold metallo-hydrolase [Cephaloticoccus sp.]MCF7759571.1 MBL fold metallo-hydrolase [Cephaloticoccus sp.]
MKTSPSISVMVAGSGAVRAHPTRGGPCYVVTIDGQNLIFDCGRCAVHNLSRFGLPVETVSEVFITHLHFDHICDLPLLLLLSWNNGRTRTLPIVGPRGIAAFLEQGLRQAYAADIKSRVEHSKKNPTHLEWITTELTKEGICRETETYKIDTLITRHAGLLNFSYRLTTTDKVIVITSDSEPDPRLVEFCRQADLVLIECSGTKEFYASKDWGGWHMTPEDIGRMMHEAGAKKVILKHLVIENFSPDPHISESMAATIRALHPAGEIVVARDGMRLTV